MPNLDVEGATLYYECVGKGPILLCVSGASGDHDIHRPLGRYIGAHFTVVAYDRRGYSQSYLIGAQDYAQRLERDADDAAALIHHLSPPDEPATVFANSSGAIVALSLLLRHPDAIRTLICHEPPLYSFLSDREQLVAEQRAVYELYRAQGIAPAMEYFARMIETPQDEVPMFLHAFDPRSGPYSFANSQYWFEREMLYYPVAPCTPESFQAHRAKLLLANGKLTRPHTFQYRANEVLANELGLELVILPGAHIGFATHAKEFTKQVMAALREKDGFYESL